VPRVREILSWYGSDNPGTRGKLARMLYHGRFAGSGKMDPRRVSHPTLRPMIRTITTDWPSSPGVMPMRRSSRRSSTPMLSKSKSLASILNKRRRARSTRSVRSQRTHSQSAYDIGSNRASMAAVFSSSPGARPAGDAAVFNEDRAIRDGSGFGSIIGRNSFQRSEPDALKFLGTIMNLYAGTQA
jgi:hypothetical protein